MMSIAAKRILVNMPGKLYEDLKRLAKIEYKSISGVIRESIMDKLDAEFTRSEINLIERGREEYRQGKSVPWRSVRRG